ncbi:MAG: O-antigen ligase family protein [Thermodesulfovibrionales bacterium]|nr:O-antigen ligase family protein [Thermodesulfovibrionales bacterium]
MPTESTVEKTRLIMLAELSLIGVFLTVSLFRLGTQLLGSDTLTPAKVFVGMSLLFWMLHVMINRDAGMIIRLLQEKTNLFLLLFLIVSFVSLINAKYIEDKTIGEVLSRIKMLTFYSLIIGIINDRKTLKLAIFAFLFGSLVTTGVGIYELATGDAFFTETGHRAGIMTKKTFEGLMVTTYGGSARVQGLYSDAGFHAHAMVIFFGLLVPWMFYGASGKARIASAVLAVAYILNIIGTGARVGWVALACAVWMFLILLKHRFKYLIWIATALIMVVIFLGLSLIPHIPTFSRLQYSQDEAFSWRLDTYRQAFQMVRDKPLFGVGTGNYLVEYYNYLDSTPELSRYFMGWLHNSYLQIWAENGTVGLLFFFCFFLSIFFGLMSATRKARDQEAKAISLGLLTAFTGYAVEFAGVPVLGQELGWMIFGLSTAWIMIIRKENMNPPNFSSVRA